MKLNHDLKQQYFAIMQYVRDRANNRSNAVSTKPSDIERQFLDFLYLICDGGWILEEREFYEMLELIKIQDHYSRQLLDFLVYSVEQMKFSKDNLFQWLDDRGININTDSTNPIVEPSLS